MRPENSRLLKTDERITDSYSVRSLVQQNILGSDLRVYPGRVQGRTAFGK